MTSSKSENDADAVAEEVTAEQEATPAAAAPPVSPNGLSINQTAAERACQGPQSLAENYCQPTSAVAQLRR